MATVPCFRQSNVGSPPTSAKFVSVRFRCSDLRYATDARIANRNISNTNSMCCITGNIQMSRLVGKSNMRFPNWSDKNRPVQAQKRARSLKFRIFVEEELYYLCSENKGADQLRGYREADLRLCFRLCRLLVFP